MRLGTSLLMLALILVDWLGLGCFRETDPLHPEVLSRELGVKVERIEGEPRQYWIHARQESVDFSEIGTVNKDLGYAVSVTLHNGTPIGFRFRLPPINAQELTDALGVNVENIENKPGQFRIYAAPGSVNFSKIGDVHTDVGYAVGLTLHNGGQIGFVIESPRHSPAWLSNRLGAHVERMPHQLGQFRVYGLREALDFSRIGAVHTDVGYAVGVTLHDGSQIGFQIESPALDPLVLSTELGADVERIPDEPGQYRVYASRDEVDFSAVGKVHTDVGYSVGIVLPGGRQIGLRLEKY